MCAINSGTIVVVRQRMVRFGHANLRVGAGALLLADHEGDHAREIGPEAPAAARSSMRARWSSNFDRWCALRLNAIAGSSRSCCSSAPLNAPLDITNRLGVFLDLGPGPGARARCLSSVSFSITANPEGSCVAATLRFPRRPALVLPLSPNSVSNTTRGFHSIGNGCVGAAPRERVRVDTTQTCRYTRPRCSGGPGRSRAMATCVWLGEVPREQLVHRHVRDDLDLISSPARRARQKRSGGACVDVVPVGLEARQHEHLIPDRAPAAPEWEEARSRAPPSLAVQPVLHGHPVRHIEGLEPMHRLLRRPSPAGRTRAAWHPGTAARASRPGRAGWSGAVTISCVRNSHGLRLLSFSFRVAAAPAARIRNARAVHDSGYDER